MKEIRDEGIKLKDGNREGRTGSDAGRGSRWRGGMNKPIGERKSGYEVKRQEQVKKRKKKAGGEREQVEMKCENMRQERKGLWEWKNVRAPQKQTKNL